jgi:phosphopantetheinyl transferase
LKLFTHIFCEKEVCLKAHPVGISQQLDRILFSNHQIWCNSGANYDCE